MQIDVIVLAYSKDHAAQVMTQAAIDSLHKSSDKHTFHIVVVETKREPIPYVGAEVILGEVPFNYNRNLNLGLTKCTSDWIVIANNDLIFHKDWIDPILELNSDSASPMSPGWQPHQGVEGKIITGFRTGVEVCGWCIVTKRATLDKIGPFDEQFSDYYQDNDYAVQLIRKQLLHRLVGTSKVTHLVGQTLGSYGTAPVNAKMRAAQAKFDAKYLNSTVCLTMIVKDEATIIKDMLQSVVHLINHWVIVDTGSTDGTQKIIRDFFAAHPEVPGTLYERPWVNFGHNRTEAMQLADGKADYMFVIDADDSISGKLSFKGLVLDTYSLRIGKGFSHWRNQLFRSGLSWRYVGVLHEYAHSDISKTNGRLEGDYYIDARCAGSRSKDPDKYRKDAAVLEEALKTEPGNARYWFYLGQSYFDFQNFVQSKRCYEKRIAMGGWPEEMFYSAWRVGQCAMNLKESDEVIMAHMVKAYEIRPTRAESLHMLAEHLRLKQKFALAYLFAKTAASLPMPENDILFVFRDVYQWKALDELGINAYYTGRAQEAVSIFKHLLDKKLVPPEQVERTKANLGFAQAKLPGVPK